VVVKDFQQPAPSQKAALWAFEEEGWKRTMDDPLPPEPGLDRKRRLHDTVNNLNRNQRVPLLKFSCCRCGEGLRWEWNGTPKPKKKRRRKSS
jgi:hypothetical protein